MGFLSSVSSRIVDLLDIKDEKKINDMQKGYDSSYVSGGEGAYGEVSAISKSLALSEDYLRRLADYDAMDNYPELSCLAGDSLIFTLEKGWVRIDELAKDGKDFEVLAYDRNRKEFVSAKATNPRVTGESGHSKPMVRVHFDGGNIITCTDDHLFMLDDDSWCRAGNLERFQRLKEGIVGVRHNSLKDHVNHYVIKVEEIDSREVIYDIEVPEYHNFICNGVVVHNSSLDLYGDSATVDDKYHNRALWVSAKDPVVREILDDLIEKKLKTPRDIWMEARSFCKNGNTFQELLITTKGVQGRRFLPTESMRRVEDEKGNLLGFIQNINGRFNTDVNNFKKLLKTRNTKVEEDGTVVFQPWEIIHTRLRSKNINSIYGYSVLHSARWVWKRLMMAEDSALLYKLTRAPARFAFYVDVGDMEPNASLAYLKRVKNLYRKKKNLSKQNKMDYSLDVLSPDEDFWFPTRNGQDSTRVDVISGPDYQATDDLNYFRGKMFSAIKVPRAYLGFGGDTNRAALAQEDAFFARTIMRIQREIKNAYREICRIHLASLNIDPDAVEFDIHMTQPSHIFELAQLELKNAQADTADRLKEYMPLDWILQKVFEFTKDDTAYLIKTKFDEDKIKQKRDVALQSELIKQYPEAMGMMAEGGMLGGEQGGGDQGGVRESRGQKIRISNLEKKIKSLTEILEELVGKTDGIKNLKEQMKKINIASRLSENSKMSKSRVYGKNEQVKSGK